MGLGVGFRVQDFGLSLGSTENVMVINTKNPIKLLTTLLTTVDDIYPALLPIVRNVP